MREQEGKGMVAREVDIKKRNDKEGVMVINTSEPREARGLMRH